MDIKLIRMLIDESFELSEGMLFKKHREIIIPFIQNLYNELLKCEYKSNSNDFIINQIDKIYLCQSKKSFELISMNENKLKSYNSQLKHLIIHYLKLREEDIIRCCLFKNNIKYESKGRFIKCSNNMNNIAQNISTILNRISKYEKFKINDDNYKNVYNDVILCNDYVNQIEKEFFELIKSKNENGMKNLGNLPFDNDIFK